MCYLLVPEGMHGAGIDHGGSGGVKQSVAGGVGGAARFVLVERIGGVGGAFCIIDGDGDFACGGGIKHGLGDLHKKIVCAIGAVAEIGGIGRVDGAGVPVAKAHQGTGAAGLKHQACSAGKGDCRHKLAFFEGFKACERGVR